MAHEPPPTREELRDAIRRLLPHRSFEIGYLNIDGSIGIVVRCPCGRTLPWPSWSQGALPSAILAYWLADHDDEMFLTPEQLRARETATIEKADPQVALDAAARLGLPLVYDPDRVMGDKP